MTYVLKTLLAVSLCCLLGGCGPSKKAADAAAADSSSQFQTVRLQIQLVTTEGTSASKSNGSALVIVQGMTPDNVVAQKPVAVAAIEETQTHIDKIVTAATTAAPAVQAAQADTTVLVKRIAEIEKPNPVKGYLEWCGAILALLCVAGLGLKLYPAAAPFTPAAEYLIVGLLIGIASWWIGYELDVIETAIKWAAAIAAAICAVFLGLKWYKAHQAGASVVQSVQAAIKAGMIDLEKVAPVFDAVQTKTAKALVNAATPNK